MAVVLTVLFIVLVVAISAFMSWERHDMAKAQIIGHLKRRRVTDLSIRFDWGDFDRDTFTYDVACTLPDGTRYRDRCKVSTRLGAGAALYWERGLPRAD